MNICNKCKNYYPNNHYCQYWDCDVTIQHEMCCGFANMTNADCNQQRRLTMMSDCISRNALLDRYDAEHVGLPGRARELIATAPAADVAEVRHGRWEAWMPDKNGETREFICTGCRFMVEMSWKQKECDYEWCPYCGCKMDKEAADDKKQPEEAPGE